LGTAFLNNIDGISLIAASAILEAVSNWLLFASFNNTAISLLKAL
jgi:hypothetical protein